MKIKTRILKSASLCTEVKVKALSIKQLSIWINNNSDYKAVIRKTQSEKCTKPSGYRFFTGGGSRVYKGYILEIYDKDNKLIKNHDTTETYRQNNEISKWILYNIIEKNERIK